jgi:hypothetical protein
LISRCSDNAGHDSHRRAQGKTYERPDLPVAPSEVGEIYGPAKQLRDPALFVENGKAFLFYTVCGEQGIAAAEISGMGQSGQ